MTKAGTRNDYSATSIDKLEFELPVRAWNCLKNENIRTVEELCTKTRAQLLRTPNFGRKSLQEIENVLQLMGLKLRDGYLPYGHPDGTAADHALYALHDAKVEMRDMLKRIARLEERALKLEQQVKFLTESRITDARGSRL